MEFKKFNFILGIIFCLLIPLSVISAVVVLLMAIAIPKATDLPFPMHKATLEFYESMGGIVEIIPTVSLVLMIVALLFFIGLIVLLIKSKPQLNRMFLYFFPVNLILLTIAIICLYMSFDKINEYYFYIYGYYFYGFIFIILHCTLIMFIPLAGLYASTFITLSDIDDKLKNKVNTAIIITTITFILIPFAGMNVLSKDQKLTIKDIKGLDYNTQLPEKKYLVITPDGKVQSKSLAGFYGTFNTLFLPLTKKNADILIKQNNKKFYLEASLPIHTFLRDYFTYNFDFNSLDKLFAEQYKKYPQHTLLNAALFAASMSGRADVSKGALKTLESVYEDPSFYVSDEGNCLRELLIYKQGGPVDSKDNLISQKDSKFCLLQAKIASGGIKKTTFEGIVIQNNKPLKNIPVALIVANGDGFDVFSYTSLIAFGYTDSEGKFSLIAETDKQPGLVIFDDNANSAKFDYSKLNNYKQGQTINLGKVELN